MRQIAQIIMAWLVLVAHCNIDGNMIDEFGYSKKEQHLWPKKYKLCAGKLQSPVTISTSKAIVISIPALELIGYHDFLPMPQTLKNNGKTIKLIMNKNVTRPCRTLPYIFGSMLQKNQTFELEELHFHWGLKNNRGAEHVLNGIRYPMEMHIIHRNIAYDNYSYALQREDGIAVVAAFFQLQDKDNEHLRSFISKLPDVQWAHTESSVDIYLALASIIPSNTDVYYIYKGSLTTPPCNEVVTWIIFAEPVPISFHQMSMFRRLSNGEGKLGDNYRLLQDIGRRKIYTRRLDHPSFSIKDIKRDSFTNLSWFWV